MAVTDRVEFGEKCYKVHQLKHDGRAVLFAVAKLLAIINYRSHW